MFNAENKKIIPKEIKTIYSLHSEVTPGKCYVTSCYFSIYVYYFFKDCHHNVHVVL